MLIRLRAIVCETGPVAAAPDWWGMARGIAEGAVLANVAWMRRRPLDELDPAALGIRYSPRPALHVGDELGQGLRLAPALVHARAGSCLDLACYCAALRRLRGRPDAHVEFRVDAIHQRGHALVIDGETTFDPSIHLI